MKLRITFYSVTPTGEDTFNIVKLNHTAVTKTINVDSIDELSSFGNDAADSNRLYLDSSNLTTDFTSITDSKILDITATWSGITYFGSFEIYGYDLGNTTGIDTNPEFNVYFIDSSSETYANLIAYRRPYSDDILIYDACAQSDNREVSYNVATSGNATIESEESIEIQQTAVLWQTYGSSRITIDTYSMSSGLVIDDNKNHEIDYTVYVDKGVKTAEGTTNVSSTNRVIVDFNFTGLATYYVNDIHVYFIESIDILHELFNKRGVQQGDFTFTYTLPNPVSTITYAPYLDANVYSFILPEFGDYVITTSQTSYEYGDQEVRLCIKSNTVYNHNWNQLERYTSNTYRFYNWASETATLVVQEMQNDKTFKSINTYTVSRFSYLDVVLSKDQVYNFNITRPSDTTTFNYLIFNYPNLRSCLENLINDVICKDLCSKCNTYNFENMNVIILTAMTYFMKLNKEYNFTIFYSSLEPSKVTEVYTMKQTLDRLSVYCLTCSKLNPKCSCS